MKQVKINIPEPCHENWNTMTGAQQGRHCDKCDKVVVDFSTYSESKFQKTISKIAEGGERVCGRFRNDQLNEKPVTYLEIEHYSLSPRQIFILAVVIVFFLGGLASCTVNKRTIGIMDVETYKRVSVKEHLNNFKKDCKDDGRTMGEFVHPKVDTVKRDTVIILKPERVIKAFFDSESFELNKQSKEAIDQVIEKLNGKKYSLEIIGHTDDRGSETFNIGLSLKRANGVKEYLMSKGIEVLNCRGAGAEFPITNNASMAGRAGNRRVEIIITWK